MILGVSGRYAAGKGEVIAFLGERSFTPLSLSDVLREELRERGESETRERMIEIGRELRARHGESVLADRLAARLAPDRNYVIDSIRHPAEVEALRRHTSAFRLVWLDAPEALRFERLRGRARPGDPTTLEALRELEGRELASEDPAGQQLEAVHELRDFELRNEGSLEDLHSELQTILRKSLYFERPGWDEYFMSIAQMVASRSNCVKRKVAAVITVDRRIISTGYNGTPRGVANCNEGGCPRCNSFVPEGTQLGDCICSHGEENALVQAAYHGVSVRSATLYTNLCPCLLCTKMIINAGIAEVVYNAEYRLSDVSLSL
ncbi:MAG: deaminase, partial [Myxococcota bacterium]